MLSIYILIHFPCRQKIFGNFFIFLLKYQKKRKALSFRLNFYFCKQLFNAAFNSSIYLFLKNFERVLQIMSVITAAMPTAKNMFCILIPEAVSGWKQAPVKYIDVPKTNAMSAIFLNFLKFFIFFSISFLK